MSKRFPNMLFLLLDYLIYIYIYIYIIYIYDFIYSSSVKCKRKRIAGCEICSNSITKTP